MPRISRTAGRGRARRRSSPRPSPGKPSFKRKYGQHHLRSGRACEPLLRFLEAAPGDRVLEIGPGGGVLTAELARSGARVIALEVDVEWACHLGRRLPAGVAVLCQDALLFPWDRLARLEAPTLVTGNLPFNVGTRLIRDVLDAAATVPERLPRAGFMVQKEVAERLVAEPGDPAYGALSVWVGARARVRWLGDLAPGAFRPPPRVWAAFVGLETRHPPFDPELLPAFDRVVGLAFGQRRKTLRNALANGAGGWGRQRAAAVLERAGIDPGVRAESLGLGAFAALARAVVALGPGASG
ncbi:MAG: 16S rRNA (adenine(1518)-N(6)/adenine(1519)-N(6))-dimethyltransferase RsmA [Holophagales bacterium]|nr:16S rRNA (adenine(1518)-N(6)/adenine(1519)-N(6))-dimethyltransferase RsmA [Holophagales bacterium]